MPDKASYIKLFREHALTASFFGLGIILLVFGLFQSQGQADPVVEVIKGEEEASQIYVDVSGSVENPGVYKLEPGSRVGEALTAAGGLSPDADRAWVSRFINLASEVTDGMKVYIPSPGGSPRDVSYNTGSDTTFATQGLININTASISELDSLWGIGASRAQDIIAGRPYSSIEELTGKGKVPQNVYERIKDQVSVY